ncbi:MAG: DUF3341 domain-containing protein [Verrucomicrobia bacterium]|nr:DUF3341 domain-containing protein [Cytophagales bacterium]
MEHTEHSEKYLVGIFDDDEVLMSAVKKIREAGIKIHEVFCPYPVHNLDVALGYKRSRLPKAAFMFGFLGTCTALAMMIFMMGIDWQMIVGGKDYLPFPNFVPVSFELTVLFAALGMVGTFLLSNDLYPGKNARMFDVRSTDDKFAMAIPFENNLSTEEVIRIVKESGAIEVNEKQFD